MSPKDCSGVVVSHPRRICSTFCSTSIKLIRISIHLLSAAGCSGCGKRTLWPRVYFPCEIEYAHVPEGLLKRRDLMRFVCDTCVDVRRHVTSADARSATAERSVHGAGARVHDADE